MIAMLINPSQTTAELIALRVKLISKTNNKSSHTAVNLLSTQTGHFTDGITTTGPKDCWPYTWILCCIANIWWISSVEGISLYCRWIRLICALSILCGFCC
ncbi:hypothetical protein FKM82_010784 [Ascaphus truei]